MSRISRRTIVKGIGYTAIAAVSAPKLYAIYKIWSGDSNSPKIKRAELSRYTPMPWGEEDITLEDISNISANELRSKIKTPSQALSWLEIVDEYNNDIKSNKDEIYRKEINDVPLTQEENFWRFLEYSPSRVFEIGKRYTLERLHTEIQKNIQFKTQTKKFALSEDDVVDIFNSINNPDYVSLFLDSVRNEGIKYGNRVYGYIGYNPDIHYDTPRFSSIRELMQEEFGSYDKCLVVDFDESGISQYIKKNGKETNVFWTQSEILPHLLKVKDYTD